MHNRHVNANERHKNIRQWFFESRKTPKNTMLLVFFDILIIVMHYYEENKMTLINRNLK